MIKNEMAALSAQIHDDCKNLPNIAIMEVCGTHTHHIRRFGLRQLLPKSLTLISGPGCPVCVTAERDIAAALFLAKKENVIFTCFGDMLKVPCDGDSLYHQKETGKNIMVVSSPMQALAIAEENPGKEVVWFGIGFETTTPHTAALIETAGGKGVKNLSVFSAHKTMPAALTALLAGNTEISGLLCPGHVAAVGGGALFDFVPEKLKKPAAIAGFGPVEIMRAIHSITHMLATGEKALKNDYPGVVTPGGNHAARELVNKIFTPATAHWRGLGEIKDSGLVIKDEWAAFDAAKRFSLPVYDIQQPAGCLCPQIIAGKRQPGECPNLGVRCTPENPLGPCMVSSEGGCAAFYRYGDE